MEKLALFMKEHFHDGVALAFSGGVDSALLLKMIAVCNITKAVAVTFFTPFMRETEDAGLQRMAEEQGIPWVGCKLDLYENREFTGNPADRCYICKKAMFGKLEQIARTYGISCLADGTNRDDTAELRPGLRAKEEYQVISPLLRCGYTKKDVRRLAKMLGVSVHDRPSSPCLVTRLPYHTRIFPEIIEKIRQMERVLQRQGFPVCRARVHNDLLRIEIPKEAHMAFMERRKTVTDAARQIGFRYITLDLEGFCSGSYDSQMVRHATDRV